MAIFVHLDRDRWDAADVCRNLVEYYEYIMSLDDCMGQLLDHLDELGITEEMIVVFTSDHGEMLDSQGWVNKGTPFEEVINVPLLRTNRRRTGLGRGGEPQRLHADTPLGV